MKIKFLYMLVFVLATHEVYGQVERQMPTEEEWRTYFYSNKKEIVNKLYRLVLEGKIKAYKTDSLISVYNLDELKLRGSTEMITAIPVGSGFVDSIFYVPFNTDHFQDLWFLKIINSSPFEEAETNTLKAMALTYTPPWGRAVTHQQPMCLLSITDIKRVLNKREYEWIKLIYYYTKNDNSILFRGLDIEDSYWEINHVKIANDVYSCDSSMLKKISNSLRYSRFYFNDYFNDRKAGISQLPILYDHQQKKYISYDDFQNRYFDERTIFMGTDSNNPSVGRDTIYRFSKEIHAPDSIVIDTIKFKILEFHFKVNQSYPLNGYYYFSTNADHMRKRNTLPTLFWFFEDYFRWKNNH